MIKIYHFLIIFILILNFNFFFTYYLKIFVLFNFLDLVNHLIIKYIKI